MTEKPLRVLILDTTKNFGGAFEIALHLVTHANLLAPGTVGLVSSQPTEVLAERVPRGIAWFHLPVRRWISARGGRALLPWYTARNLLQREMPAARRFARIVREFDASIVHLNNGLIVQMFAAMACRRLGVKCVCSYRGYAHPSRVLTPLEPTVQRYIASSKAVVDYLVDVLGVDPSKIAYVYDPVDTDVFSPDAPAADLEALFGIPKRRKVFSIFGRLVSWKGHEVFLRAARDVIEAVPDAHAMIVGDTSDGDPAYGEALRRMAGELGIANNVTFTGYRMDTVALIRASDAIVHASTVPEPFGMVVVEGMACGKACVAMDEGGPIDMIDSGVHGLLVQPGQHEPMARAITTLLKHPELAATYGTAARQRCLERFSASTIARQHLELYRNVIAAETTNISARSMRSRPGLQSGKPRGALIP